jgi:hypothetical protein
VFGRPERDDFVLPAQIDPAKLNDALHQVPFEIELLQIDEGRLPRQILLDALCSYGGALRDAPESSLEVAPQAHRLDVRQGHKLKPHHHTTAWHAPSERIGNFNS